MGTKKSKFQDEMESYLINFKEKCQYIPSLGNSRRWYYYDILDNLYPPIKYGFMQYAYDNTVKMHDFVNHVRSSQVFGFNFLFPLLTYKQNVILSVLSNATKIEMERISNFSFEYTPEGNFLGEWESNTKPGPYATSADVAIFTQDKDGIQYAFLFEIKFTEESFSECGGFKSASNKIKRNCEDRELLNKDFNNCYMQIDYGRKKARKYFNCFGDLKTAFPGHPEVKDCPFKYNQCLRNHAFARYLCMNGKAKKAYFGLIYHDQNKEIKNQWDFYYNLVSDDLRKELLVFKVSDFLVNSGDDTLKRYFKDRYRI